MAYTSIPFVQITNNIPVDGILINCFGTIDENVIYSPSITDVIVGQTLYEFGEADNSEIGYAAKILDIDYDGVNFAITVDRPNKKTFSGLTISAITDKGVITKVRIVDGGDGFTTLPVVDMPITEENFDGIPSNDRRKAKIVVFGESIGKIKSIEIVNQGFNQESTPLLKTPICAVVGDVSRAFKKGSLVYDANHNYGVVPLTEEDIKENGPYAYVKSFDSTRNYLILEDSSDTYELTNDSYLVLTNEDGVILTNENEFTFTFGSLLKDFETGGTAKFLRSNRAILVAKSGGVVKKKPYFSDSSSFTSESFIRLHDGLKIQDYSYFVKTIPTLIDGISNALAFSDYKDILKKLVHPAGYSMYGETHIDSYAQIKSELFFKPDYANRELSLIILVIQLISVYNQMDVNETVDGRAYKFRAIVLYIEKFLSAYKGNDMNDQEKKLFQIVLEKYIDLGGIASDPTRYSVFFYEHVDVFAGFRPRFLNEKKFTMSEDAVSTFDNAKFTDFAPNIFEYSPLRKFVPMQEIVVGP